MIRMGLLKKTPWKRQPRESNGRWEKNRKHEKNVRHKPFLRRNGRRGRRGRLSVTVKSGRRKAASVQDLFDTVLDRNFTPEEEKLLRSKEISVTVVKGIPGEDGEMVLGGYNGKRRGRHEIILDKSSVTEETLTHELTHVLQEESTSRTDLEKELRCSELKKENDVEKLDGKLHPIHEGPGFKARIVQFLCRAPDPLPPFRPPRKKELEI